MNIWKLLDRGGAGWLKTAVCIAVGVIALSAASSGSFAASLTQKRFSSPEDAVKAMVTAVREHDEASLEAILGPGSRKLISSGDDVADKADREKFLSFYDQQNALVQESATTMVLQIGSDNWPLPIPLVKKGAAWVFDIDKGKREILKRRIGRNELRVMDVLNAYVDAQHEYASRDCLGTGRVEFAQRLGSSEGKRDGLYWPAQESEEQSPLGPFVAQAAQEGYTAERILSPFHGYYFKILTGQGKDAPGGAYDYLVNGRMILGFALVAYPAEYGNSGVMTFMVNQEGTVYEKNLGKKTRRIAEAMKVFDPDRGWRKVKVDSAGTRN